MMRLDMTRRLVRPHTATRAHVPTDADTHADREVGIIELTQLYRIDYIKGGRPRSNADLREPWARAAVSTRTRHALAFSSKKNKTDAHSTIARL